MLSSDRGVVPGRPGQIQFGSTDVIIGVIFHPGVIQARVIGNEVEHQAQAALAQTVAEPRQSGIPSQKFMDGIAGNRKPRAENVLFP